MARTISQNTLRTAYEDFISLFRNYAEDSDCSVKFAPITFTFDQGPESFKFQNYIYLAGVPSRRMGGSKKLNILMKIQERISKSDWTIQKSTVHMDYLVSSDDDSSRSSKTILIQSLHFDFEEKGQKGHPFFHLQLDMEPVDPHELIEAIDLELEVTVPGASRDCQFTTRIPTAEMTFTSVLYSLMAEHIGSEKAEIFKEFAAKVDAIEKRLPPLKFDALKTSLNKSSTFKSSHWFAHMFAQS